MREEILNELGVHFEASASEATAAAMLAASINYPLRGAVTWKSTVGTNVASDALVESGLGRGQGRRAHHPRRGLRRRREHHAGAHARLRDEVADVAARSAAAAAGRSCARSSRASSCPRPATRPVMLMLRIRACHVYGRFTAQGQSPAAVLGGRCAGRALARLRPHHPAAVDLRAGAGEDRDAAAGRPALHRRARPERTACAGELATSASCCRAGCTTTRCARWSCSAARTPSARARCRCTS